MKTAIITILLVVAAHTSYAQQSSGESPAKGETESAAVGTASDALSPEQAELRNTVLRILYKELELTDEQFEGFAQVYGEYRQNIRTGMVRKPKIEDIATASDSEINTLLTANLDNYIHIAMVRKVYIPIFEKILTPAQVYKLYDIDNCLSKKAHDELRKRNGK